MDGEINIDSLEYTSPENSYFLDNLKLVASRSDDHRKRLDFISPFLRGNIEGDYSYRTLPTSFLNILRRYLPAVLPASGKKKNSLRRPTISASTFISTTPSCFPRSLASP